MGEGVEFTILDGRYAVVKLPKGTRAPLPPEGARLWSETITDEEISLICPEENVPLEPGLSVERTWRALKVTGPLDFELKGILASLLNPLADAGVGVFALSTYNTDYIFVKEFSLRKSVDALTAAGHRCASPCADFDA